MTMTFKTETGSQLSKSLRLFVSGISDPTMLFTRDFRLVYANSEARVRFSSVDIAEGMELGWFVETLFPEADWAKIALELAHHTAEESALFFLPQGVKQTHMRVTSLEFGSEAGTADTLLAASFFDPDADAIMRRLEYVLDSSTDGIFIVNKNNHIVYFNQACEKLTGWEKDAAVMQTYECANVLRCHNDEGESLGSESLCPAKVFFHRDSVPKPYEMLITTTAGKERYVETNYSPIKNAAGDVEFIVGIIRDIDERKRLESQLIQNRNLVMLGSLVSGIAHEIKNPLGILMSSVEIVLNEDRPVAQRREAASYIKDEVRRLDERMKYFLAFAKPKPLNQEKVDVGELVGKVSRSFQGAVKNRRFHVMTPGCTSMPAISGDPDLLHQVFLNLILNAQQACSQGGVLSITCENLGDSVRVRFTDNGDGINEADLPKIFDPFFTTKADGTGLGLSIVHQILTSHRGKIHVSNNGNGKPGVTFEVTLPVDGDAA